MSVTRVQIRAPLMVFCTWKQFERSNPRKQRHHTRWASSNADHFDRNLLLTMHNLQQIKDKYRHPDVFLSLCAMSLQKVPSNIYLCTKSRSFPPGKASLCARASVHIPHVASTLLQCFSCHYQPALHSSKRHFCMSQKMKHCFTCVSSCVGGAQTCLTLCSWGAR